MLQVQQEIFDVEKNLELMRKAIADKSYATKVVHTRMEARMHRPDIELCRDYAYMRYVYRIDIMFNTLLLTWIKRQEKLYFINKKFRFIVFRKRLKR